MFVGGLRFFVAKSPALKFRAVFSYLSRNFVQLTGNTVSGNTISGNMVSGDTLSGNRQKTKILKDQNTRRQKDKDKKV